MTYTAESDAARRLFAANWLSTEIAWPNTPFDTPSDEPWVRFSILPADAGIVSSGNTGNRRYRHTGLVAIGVFVPAGTGDGAAKELVDEVCEIFRGVTSEGVTFGAPYVTDGGVSNGWYGLTVWAPFRRDSLF